MRLLTPLLFLTSGYSQQFHLSLVGDGSGDYMLDWKTSANVNHSVVYFQNEPLTGTFAGAVEEEKNEYINCWFTRLKNLTPGQQYHYTLNQSDATAQRPTFRVEDSITWAVFGDLGSREQGGASGISFPALEHQAASNAYQGILHIGDISYELTGINGRDYMNEMSLLSSSRPLHATVGNHEYRMAMAPYFTLSNYQRRFAGLFAGAGVSSESDSNQFYSFNSGYIHYIVLDTEVYGEETFYIEEADQHWVESEAGRDELRVRQLIWMEQDLKRVNRKETPFVVVCAHRPPFKAPRGLIDSDNLFGTDIVPLLSNYHVDLLLCGHVHAYLRFDATQFNGYRIPPIIVSGAGGSGQVEKPKSQLDLGIFKDVMYDEQYGYGLIKANATDITWRWGHSAVGDLNNPDPIHWTQKDYVTFPVRSVTTLDINQHWIFLIMCIVVLVGGKIAYDLSKQRRRHGYDLIV